jgi:WD40 repeat protein
MSEWQHPKMFSDGQGNLFLNFGQYGQEIELACFSADGTTLLTVKEVGVASIWDIASHSPIGEIHPTSPLVGNADATSFGSDFKVFIESVALNNDGSLAILGLNDGTAGLYSTQSGDRLAWYYPPGTNPAETFNLVRSVAFSPDGSLALVGFLRRSVGVWNVLDHTLVKFLTGLYPDHVFNHPFVLETLTTSVAASRDNGYIFGGYSDLTATIWNLDNGEVVFDAHQHVEDIIDVWLGDKKVRWATTGGCLWEGFPGQAASQLLSSGETWLGAGFSPDGQSVVVRTANEANTRWSMIKRWSVNGKSEILGKEDVILSHSTPTITLGKTTPVSIFVNESNRCVITTPKNSVEVKCDEPITDFRLSPQEDILATYGQDNPIQLWRVPTGECLHVLHHRYTLSDVTFTADGHLLAAGSLGMGGPGAIWPIYVWNARSGALWCELRGHTHRVHALAFDPQGRWLASASFDRTVRLWQLDRETPGNSHEIWQLYYEDLEFDNLKVLSDGRMIVFRRDSLEVWQDQQKRLDIPAPHYYRAHWYITRNEKCILGTFRHQRIGVWDLETGQELPGYQSDIIRPEVVPSIYIIASSQIRSQPTAACNLWRNPWGNFIHVSTGMRGWVSPLALSEDGNFIVVPGTENAALIDLTDGQRLVATGPFTGKLRASRILPNQTLLLNSAGELFIIVVNVHNS